MSYVYSQEQAFREAEQYSQFLIHNLRQATLPDQFLHNISDFMEGDTYRMKTTGDVVLTQGAEDVPPVYQRMDTGEVTLTIDQFPETAWYITDVMRQDGSQIDQLHQEHSMSALRAISEYYETTYLAAANNAQTSGDANNIDGVAHRKVAEGTSNVMSFDDFVAMDLAFNQLSIPTEGRVAIVTPKAAASINKTVAQQAWQATPWLEGLLETGIQNKMQFVGKLFNWNIFVSTRLPSIASETIGADTVTGGKANLFMSILDDQHKPLMGAWRQQPTVEHDRNMNLKRNEYLLNARFGVKHKRVDTIGCVITDDSTY